MLHGIELRKVRKERDAVVLAMLYRCLEDCCSRRRREQGDRPGRDEVQHNAQSWKIAAVRYGEGFVYWLYQSNLHEHWKR